MNLAVIGGGPAGSAAARRAAESGLAVTLVEARPMPRPKLCGGAVSIQALADIGEPLPEQLVLAECRGARVRFADFANECRRAERLAVMVDRGPFDHWLAGRAEQAGARVVYATARALEVGHDGVRVHGDHGLDLRADAAIVCTGANGALTRTVRPPDLPGQRGYCLEAHIPRTDPDLYPDLADMIEVRFGVARFGYGWVFHHGDVYAVGVGGLLSLVPDMGRAYADFVARTALRGCPARPRGHFIPLGGIDRPLVGDRVLLAGDAGGFVDPFTGEGIAGAIRSGQLAAEAVREAAVSGGFGAASLRRYARACARSLGGDLRWALRLTRLMHRNPGLFLRLMASDRDVLDHFVDVAARRTTYRRYLGWLLPRVPMFLARHPRYRTTLDKRA